MRRKRFPLIALLLFGSGLCALVYQTVWMRQFRLVFGGSTAASAAVLAIFMGGLGFGGIKLGKLAARTRDPLRLYAALEMGIAIASAATPGVIEIIDRVYIATGGSSTLGLTIATLLRLLLSALVLLLPTYLMGGTLPAATRAVEIDEDLARQRTAVLYGTNTLGAVAGVLIPTFFALEHLGNRKTLWAAAALNLIVAGIAWFASSGGGAEEEVEEEAPPPATSRTSLFVLISAGVTGFAFLLMELVWYRMLTPLLGGTLFSFGLILAAALLGIGIGGFLYSLRDRAPSLIFFAVTCALEALLLAIPFALGDRIAVFALLLRSLSMAGFSGHVIGWTAVAMLVVFPASVVAGVQFPALIALLGRGERNVSVDVGRTYAWNTVGAILGSIAGGFGAIPLLSATGAWRLVIILLAALSAAALVQASRELRIGNALPAVLLGALALFCLNAVGPTAAWRHSPIGAGRAQQTGRTRNDLIDWLHYQRRIVEWEEDGIESSVALVSDTGHAFVVNGKVDGHARYDAGTQVMSGLLGAYLHGHVRSALVVGLGTGSTAGWLGAVPSIDRVDVVELEPATLRVARDCTPVNRDVLHNPKVHVTIGDGREVLRTTKRSYDLIASEPSNPYRAGIASLYTTAFYRAVSRRLAHDGLFLQWMQAYEIDSQTLRTVYATFHDTFPYVQTWQTQWGDLLLIGSFEPASFDANALRARIQQPPYADAMAKVWRVTDLEGVLAHYVAGTDTADAMAKGIPVNTDDRMNVEFAFARTLGTEGRLDINDVRAVAKALQDDVPHVDAGRVDLDAVERRRLSMIVVSGGLPFTHPFLTPELVARGETAVQYLKGVYSNVLGAWSAQHVPPQDPIETLTFADSLAQQANPAAEPFIENLRRVEPVEADLVLARLRWKQGKADEAAALLERAFVACRRDPWPLRMTLERALQIAPEVAAQDKSGGAARRLFAVLAEPFAVTVMNQQRLETRAFLAEVLEPGGRCGPATLEVLRTFEPHVPWRRQFLAKRAQCYAQQGVPLAAKAKHDLEEYDRSEPVSLKEVVTGK